MIHWRTRDLESYKLSIYQIAFLNFNWKIPYTKLDPVKRNRVHQFRSSPSIHIHPSYLIDSCLFYTGSQIVIAHSITKLKTRNVCKD